jgi:hypothetical protein
MHLGHIEVISLVIGVPTPLLLIRKSADFREIFHRGEEYVERDDSAISWLRRQCAILDSSRKLWRAVVAGLAGC